MDVNFQRKVDRFFGAFLCRILSLIYRKKNREGAGKSPCRILVIMLSEMGSLVLAQPMFQRIREKFPGASVHVLLFEKNREILDLIEVIPPENILTISDKSIARFTRDSLNILNRMRSIRFDTVIDCELFARISSLFSFFTGAAVRVGFHGHTMEGLYRGDFINRPVLYNPYHSIPVQFVGLVDAVDSSAVPCNKFSAENVVKESPQARIGEAEILGIKNRLYSDYPDIRGKKLVLLYPSGGILPIRAWPLVYFCKLAEGLLHRGYAVAIIGLKEDKGLASVILSHCGDSSCVDLTGYTKSIRELIVLFHIASLLITNDGGPGQFAVLTPIKAILFYGPETPVLYGPLSDKVHVFYRSLSCSPCLTAYNHRNSPCDGDNVCLKSIQPEEVLEKALSILQQDK
ncbi:MAG: glycosyltransferase family 9 protein [Deltaproteobacteria bacterium]